MICVFLSFLIITSWLTWFKPLRLNTAKWLTCGDRDKDPFKPGMGVVSCIDRRQFSLVGEFRGSEKQRDYSGVLMSYLCHTTPSRGQATLNVIIGHSVSLRTSSHAKLVDFALPLSSTKLWPETQYELMLITVSSLFASSVLLTWSLTCFPATKIRWNQRVFLLVFFF